MKKNRKRELERVGKIFNADFKSCYARFENKKGAERHLYRLLKNNCNFEILFGDDDSIQVAKKKCRWWKNGILEQDFIRVRKNDFLELVRNCDKVILYL